MMGRVGVTWRGKRAVWRETRLVCWGTESACCEPRADEKVTDKGEAIEGQYIKGCNRLWDSVDGCVQSMTARQCKVGVNEE